MRTLMNLRIEAGALMLVMPLVLSVLVTVVMGCRFMFVAMMMLLMVSTPMRMAVLITVLLVVGGMLVGVSMMTVFVRMVMLVFVSAAHGLSSNPLGSERSPLQGLSFKLGKDSVGVCQSTIHLTG